MEVVLELVELAVLVEDELSVDALASVEELAVDELEELTPSALSSSDKLISPSPLLSISLKSEDSCEAMLDPELELLESLDWLDSRLLSVSEPNWLDGGGGGDCGALVEVVESDTEEAVEVPSELDVSPCRFCTAEVEELPAERSARRVCCSCDHRLDPDDPETCIWMLRFT